MSRTAICVRKSRRAPMAKNQKLGQFLGRLLLGTADLGFSALPLIKAFKDAKAEDDWKEIGLVEWIQSDPNAAEIVARALERGRTHLPETARCALIVALGGTPS